MRSRLFVPLLGLSAACVAAGPSIAQGYGRMAPDDPMTTASNARTNYGGGFIEMLMTGRDPTPYGRAGAVYNRPGGYAYGQPARAPRPLPSGCAVPWACCVARPLP